ncbi:MAG: hypothetical protein KGI45_02335 [Patescibacteria group bacterium]|nr:hypothetical protein [Patescibacteria group bacterium]MDE1940641.1 hypothetical protein [Patescibacteria group bacterium]MDE1966889.1 hypothetical protein [Patescibacteria group bacterium]
MSFPFFPNFGGGSSFGSSFGGGAGYGPGGYGGSQLAPVYDANSLAVRLASIGDVVIYLLVALAVVYIVWTVFQYFVKGKEGDENRKEAGMRIFWAILGLFIIVSLWGLVNILVNTFWTGYNQAPAQQFPNANFVSGPQY